MQAKYTSSALARFVGKKHRLSRTRLEPETSKKTEVYVGPTLSSDTPCRRVRESSRAAAIAKTGTWKLTIVQRNELHRFVVLPKRWIVERTLAWISHNRRLARDFERYARSAAAFIRLAMIRIMLRRLTNPTLCS